MNALLALARSPSAGAAIVVRDGRPGAALLLVGAATVISAVHTIRFATDVSLQDLLFGPGRAGAVGVLLATVGRDMTAVVLDVVETAWTALLVVTAFGPFLLWVLGSTAVHAASRLVGVRRPFRPMLVLVGYATGLTRPVADLAGIALGSTGPGGAVAELLGDAALVWSVALVWHGVRAHYGVSGRQALVLLVVALVLFFLVPATVALVALVAVLVIAVLLEYVPAR